MSCHTWQWFKVQSLLHICNPSSACKIDLTPMAFGSTVNFLQCLKKKSCFPRLQKYNWLPLRLFWIDIHLKPGCARVPLWWWWWWLTSSRPRQLFLLYTWCWCDLMRTTAAFGLSYLSLSRSPFWLYPVTPLYHVSHIWIAVVKRVSITAPLRRPGGVGLPSLYSVSQGPLTWIMGKPQCCLVHLFVNHWCFEGNAYLRMPLKGLIYTTKFVTNFGVFFAQFGYAKSHRELILCSRIWFRGPNSECILPRFCRFGDDTTSCLDERNFQFQCCSRPCNE